MLQTCQICRSTSLDFILRILFQYNICRVRNVQSSSDSETTRRQTPCMSCCAALSMAQHTYSLRGACMHICTLYNSYVIFYLLIRAALRRVVACASILQQRSAYHTDDRPTVRPTTRAFRQTDACPRSGTHCHTLTQTQTPMPRC